MAENKRKNPPKHLKTSGGVERMPARYNDRLEAERQRQENQIARSEGTAQYDRTQHRSGRHHEHSSHENVTETPVNTRLFYEKLLPLAQSSHKKNQRYLHIGIVWLFVLPVILFIVRNLTSGNKIAFLIIWIIGMFIIAAALIIIAYQDEVLQESLDQLQEFVPEVEDNQLGKLSIVSPESREWMAESTEQFLQRMNSLYPNLGKGDDEDA